MPSFTRLILLVPTLLAAVSAQGVIQSAQGTKGSPASLALQVDITNAKDANVIKVSEVAANIVNECGRTLLAGNSTCPLIMSHLRLQTRHDTFTTTMSFLLTRFSFGHRN